MMNITASFFMIIFHIITIFPDIFSSYFNESILRRAQEKKIIKIKIYNIRDFAKDKHKIADDRPYGGGAGMVMRAEPIIRAVESVLKKIPPKADRPRAEKIILFSAKGKQFNQETAFNWSKKYRDIIMICGRYEGIDERVKKVLKAQEISIGPYVLTDGEIPAMILVSSISRHIPGVLGKIESLEENKGSYPAYTRPEVFKWKGKKYRVPKILLSGDHKRISEWRKKYGKII